MVSLQSHEFHLLDLHLSRLSRLSAIDLREDVYFLMDLLDNRVNEVKVRSLFMLNRVYVLILWLRVLDVTDFDVLVILGVFPLLIVEMTQLLNLQKVAGSGNKATASSFADMYETPRGMRATLVKRLLVHDFGVVGLRLS